MVTVLVSAELSSSRSRYNEVRQLVDGTKEHVTSAMQTVEAEDRARGLYSLQVAPASLLEYPKFSGRDSECYFNFKEKVIRCLIPTRYLA